MMTPKEVLDVKMLENELEAVTIREYFAIIAHDVWIEGEGFSGKRAGGSSGWQGEVIASLCAAGAIDSVADKYGALVPVDYRAADKLVAKAILEMGR